MIRVVVNFPTPRSPVSTHASIEETPYSKMFSPLPPTTRITTAFLRGRERVCVPYPFPDAMVFCAAWFDGTELRWQSLPPCLPLQYISLGVNTKPPAGFSCWSPPWCSSHSRCAPPFLRSVFCTIVMVSFSFPVVFQIAVRVGEVVPGCCSPPGVASKLLHLCQMSLMVSASKRT